jgi:hypothetical protein
MKTLLTCLLATGLAGLAFAVDPQPTATSPENALLSVWYGEWEFTSETFKTPISEPSMIAGTFSGGARMNGWASEFRYSEGDPAVNYLEVDYWDPTAAVPDIYAKNYPFGVIRNTKAPCFRYMFISDDGYAECSAFSMDGKVCTFSSSWEEGDGKNKVTYTLWGDEVMADGGKKIVKTTWLSWKDKCGRPHRVKYSCMIATRPAPVTVK